MSIQVNALTKIYGTQTAVDQISFEVGKGDIVGFLGPNGAGKSTTMKMITSYLPPSRGSIRVCGFDVQADPLSVRKSVGYLPEANPLYYDMYVREYLKFAAGIYRLGKQSGERIEEMIQLTGLTKESHKKIGALSKGYKQRVGLAQAILHDPAVLILDEPTTGLDPNQIIEIRELIKTIGKSKTVLLSTHIMQEVEAMCNRVIIINNGKIVADDEISKLKNRKQSEKTILVNFEQSVSVGLLKKLKNTLRFEIVGDKTYRLYTEQIAALKKELLQWALDNDLNIASLTEEKQSLEEVFRQLTQSAKASVPAE